jgi:hypothetical protein
MTKAKIKIPRWRTQSCVESLRIGRTRVNAGAEGLAAFRARGASF